MIRTLIVLFFLLVSCAKTPSPTPGCLRISFKSYPATVDPRRSGDFTSSTLICLIFEGLTRCQAGGEIEPALAEKVDISPDQLTYRFHLRSSYWTDGKPVTASDFERSWKKILDPSFPSVCAYLFYSIQNAEKAYKGLASPDEIGIHALDEKTLEVTLERPTPYFLSLTAFPAYLPIPQHQPEQFDLFDQNHLVSFVSNGPFKVQQIRPDAQINLKKNDLYWNKNAIKLDEIQISIVSNPATAWKMFEHKELDWIGGSVSPLPYDSLQMIRNHYPLRTDPMAATTFCTFHTRHIYLSNKNIRKAFAFAINRDEIVGRITQMGETVGTRCIPPSLVGNRNKILFQSFDPELAQLHLNKGLQELGIERSQLNGLTLLFRSTDRQIAQAIQQEWKEVLGIDINLKECETNSFRDLMQRRDYEIALNFWIAQYSDPINILERFLDDKNSKNYPGWSNERYQQVVESAIAETDRLERLRLIDTAEEILIDEMPLSPIFHWSNSSVSQPHVKNMLTTPNGGVLFESCYTERN